MNGGNPYDCVFHSMSDEIIVVVERDANLRVTNEGIVALAGGSIEDLSRLISTVDGELRPLFGSIEHQILRDASVIFNLSDEHCQRLASYYNLRVGTGDASDIARKILSLRLIDGAYVKARAAAASADVDSASRRDCVQRPMPKYSEPPNHTPDFTKLQGYLEPAPIGIDAKYAWSIPGGDGQGVNIIDIEGGWRFCHEDLRQNQGGLVYGYNHEIAIEHGTGMIGILGADKTPFGITGICPAAYIRASSVFENESDTNSSRAILEAAKMLRPGDLMLIESHRRIREDQEYLPIEWWPDDFLAVKTATDAGIIVVAAAGNGGADLDSSNYDTPLPGFPKDWKNPFRRSTSDSGAILAGAGAPPENFNGNSRCGLARSRARFTSIYSSNYGSNVDAQGWGAEVATTGLGSLQGGSDPNRWYTDKAAGTSSAAPIVLGSIACVQGIMRSANLKPLSPSEARELLRNTGTPQQYEKSFELDDRVGNQPDLRQLVPAAKSLRARQDETA